MDQELQQKLKNMVKDEMSTEKSAFHRIELGDVFGSVPAKDIKEIVQGYLASNGYDHEVKCFGSLRLVPVGGSYLELLCDSQVGVVSVSIRENLLFDKHPDNLQLD